MKDDAGALIPASQGEVGCRTDIVDQSDAADALPVFGGDEGTGGGAKEAHGDLANVHRPESRNIRLSLLATSEGFIQSILQRTTT